jgi:hypothetical protein
MITDVVERCLIHARKMDDEGWYVTADVLGLAAERIRELEKLISTLEDMNNELLAYIAAAEAPCGSEGAR